MDAEPYIGEIRMFAGNYAPEGWALCNGQSLTINDNQALYALIGSAYGGTSSTFNLPDLRGRVPIHQSSNYPLAKAGGTEETNLLLSQLPAHTHVLSAQTAEGKFSTPVNNIFAGTGSGDNEYYEGTGNTTLGPLSLSPTGNNSSFSIVQPSLAISFIIALSGIFPVQD